MLGKHWYIQGYAVYKLVGCLHIRCHRENGTDLVALYELEGDSTAKR